MVFCVVKFLNYFPVKGGVSTQFSPKAILSGKVIHYKYYCMPFGTHCQVDEEVAPLNILVACIQGTMSLGPSGNVQGGHRFILSKVVE